jgi:hypothetical protein
MKTALVLTFGIIVWPLLGLAEECAQNSSELDKTPQLQQIKNLFGEKQSLGFVNETQGSYFFLERDEHQFMVRFYTSGLLDLYGIERISPVSFCDDGKTLLLIGLGRKEKVQILGSGLILGAGGPRKSFTVGKMPKLLKKLHHLEDRLAAVNP